MANVNLFAPKLVIEESPNYSNDPTDAGGPTKYGITLATWKQFGYDKNGDGIIDAEDVKLLTADDFTVVLKKHFWDRWQADQIKNQSVAELLVDWVYNSGAPGIIHPQRLLGVTDDGIVGAATITAVNGANQADFHARVLADRGQFFNDIIAHDVAVKQAYWQANYHRAMTPQEILAHTDERFRKGWFNRLKRFVFSA